MISCAQKAAIAAAGALDGQSAERKTGGTHAHRAKKNRSRATGFLDQRAANARLRELRA
jgi:hypothetical protein